MDQNQSASNFPAPAPQAPDVNPGLYPPINPYQQYNPAAVNYPSNIPIMPNPGAGGNYPYQNQLQSYPGTPPPLRAENIVDNNVTFVQKEPQARPMTPPTNRPPVTPEQVLGAKIGFKSRSNTTPQNIIQSAVQQSNSSGRRQTNPIQGPLGKLNERIRILDGVLVHFLFPLFCYF